MPNAAAVSRELAELNRASVPKLLNAAPYTYTCAEPFVEMLDGSEKPDLAVGEFQWILESLGYELLAVPKGTTTIKRGSSELILGRDRNIYKLDYAFGGWG